jgi:hypothetical protein
MEAESTFHGNNRLKVDILLPAAFTADQVAGRELNFVGHAHFLSFILETIRRIVGP